MSLFAQILRFDFFNLLSLVPVTEGDGSKRAGPLDWWDSGVAQNSLSVRLAPWQEGHVLWFSFPPPIGRAVTLCWVSRRRTAEPVATARLCQQESGLPGKSQGWGRAEVKPGCQVCQTGCRSAGTWPGMDAAPVRVSAAWYQARQLGSELPWA